MEELLAVLNRIDQRLASIEQLLAYAPDEYEDEHEPLDLNGNPAGMERNTYESLG